MTTINEVLSDLDQISEQAANRDRAAAKQRATAERAREQADELAQKAAQAARLSGNEVLRAFHPIMRELSQQVSDARQAAIASGEAAVDTWIQYRLTAARIRGQWSSLSDDYQRLTGRPAPPGPSIPELRAEQFDQLVNMVLPTAERAAFDQACLDTVAAKDAHRAKVEAAKKARERKAG